MNSGRRRWGERRRGGCRPAAWHAQPRSRCSCVLCACLRAPRARTPLLRAFACVLALLEGRRA